MTTAVRQQREFPLATLAVLRGLQGTQTWSAAVVTLAALCGQAFCHADLAQLCYLFRLKWSAGRGAKARARAACRAGQAAYYAAAAAPCRLRVPSRAVLRAARRENGPWAAAIARGQEPQPQPPPPPPPAAAPKRARAAARTFAVANPGLPPRALSTRSAGACADQPPLQT